MGEWKDATSRRRGDSGEIRQVEYKTPTLRIIVHRHKDCQPDRWLLTVHELRIDLFNLIAKDLEAAKVEALERVREALREFADGLPGLARTLDPLQDWMSKTEAKLQKLSALEDRVHYLEVRAGID